MSKKISISYGVTVCNEIVEVERLLRQLLGGQERAG